MRQLRAIQKKLQDALGDIRPSTLQIEVTNACNFRCIMCPFHGPEKASERPVGYIDPDNYYHIVKQFKEMGGRLVIPQGAGESFLHKQFTDFIEYTKTLDLSVAFNTNGSCLTPEIMSKMMDLEVDEIGFSLDALQPDTFRQITGGDLRQTENAILQMVSMRKKSAKKQPLLRVLLVEQEMNADEIEAYVKRWITIADEVVIQTRRTGAGRALQKPRTEPRKPCRHLFDTLFVQWDGKMVVCCEDWESVTDIGNAFKTPLQYLWKNQLMNQYRKSQKNGVYYPPDICRVCEAWAGGKEHRVKHSNAIECVTALTRVWRRKDMR